MASSMVWKLLSTGRAQRSNTWLRRQFL